jgi:hypothetical protein
MCNAVGAAGSRMIETALTMALLWYRDYEDKPVEELRVLAGLSPHDRSHRDDLIRTLMKRDADRGIAIVVGGFVLSVLLLLVFRN